MEWNDQIIDEALRQSASSNDQSYPDNLPSANEIWNAINTKRSRRKVVRIQRLSAAAAVLLITMAITLWVASKKNNDIVSFPNMVRTIKLPVDENEAIAYIRRQCAGNNIVCRSPAFKELQSELDSSSSELTTIDQQIKLFGTDEQLLRARIRIENHQARIVKAMLQIL